VKEKFTTGWGRYIITAVDVFGDVVIQWLGVVLLLIIGASYMDAYRGQSVANLTDAQITEWAQGMILISIVILLVYYVGRFVWKLAEWLAERWMHQRGGATDAALD